MSSIVTAKYVCIIIPAVLGSLIVTVIQTLKAVEGSTKVVEQNQSERYIIWFIHVISTGHTKAMQFPCAIG
jgi:hypothetical protein